MNKLSRDFSEKLRYIRKCENLTQCEFSEIAGLSINTVRAYESGQQPARTEVMVRVVQVSLFKKYTMWLLHDEILPELGQCAPDVLDVKTNRINKQRLKKNTQKIFKKKSSPDFYMETIINSITNLDKDELKKLARLLSRRGSLFLLEFLDSNNQDLLGLKGIKKQAACQLKNMDDEKVREILVEMDKAYSQSIKVEELKIKNASN